MDRVKITTALAAAFFVVGCNQPPPPPVNQITEIERGINGDAFEVRTRDNGRVELYVRRGHDCVVNDIYTRCLKPGDVLVDDPTGKVKVPRYSGGELGEQESSDEGEGGDEG